MKSFHLLAIATLVATAACNDDKPVGPTAQQPTSAPQQAANAKAEAERAQAAKAQQPVVSANQDGAKTTVTVDSGAAAAKTGEVTKTVGENLKAGTDVVVGLFKNASDSVKKEVNAFNSKVEEARKKGEEITSETQFILDAQGNYFTACLPATSFKSAGAKAAQIRYEIAGETLYATEVAYADEKCQSAIGELTYDMAITVEKAVASETRGVDLSFDDIKLTPKAESLVKFANENKLCGYASWSVDKDESVAGKDCGANLLSAFPQKGNVYLGSLKHSKNVIQVTELPPRADTAKHLTANGDATKVRDTELKYTATQQ